MKKTLPWLVALAVMCTLALTTHPVFAQDSVAVSNGGEAVHAGGEANLVLPDLGSVSFLGGTSGRTLLMLGSAGLRAGARLRSLHLHPAQEHARASHDARSVRADLRDLQDLPDHPGQVPDDPVALHRRDHPLLLRVPAALRGREGRGHPGLQRHRHRGQLRRRLVRHPGEHLREFAHRVREPARQAVPVLRHPAQGGHEHRHAADQRRAAADALHPAVRAE